MTTICTTCGKSPALPDVIFSRGAWWHRPCARVFVYADGAEYVDFPSGGRCGPSTIIMLTEYEQAPLTAPEAE